MKIQIALAANGTDYTSWQDTMKGKPNFGKIERIDDNKMAAYDVGGNIIETFNIENDLKNKSVDTLDSEQTGVPIDKTKGDVQVGDPKLEKDGV